MRYKVKLEQRLQDGEWMATLYEDPQGQPLVNTGLLAIRETRQEALSAIGEKRDRLEAAKTQEPEWVSLDDVPEPQSLKAV